MSVMEKVREQFFRTDVWLRVALGLIFIGFSGWMTATWSMADENKERVTRLEEKVEAAKEKAQEAKDAAEKAEDKAGEARDQSVRNGAKLDALLRRETR